MNRFKWLAAPILIVSLALVGCGGGDVDTAKLEESFSNAEPAKKSAVDEVVSAVKAGEYAKAGSALGKLASRAKLTPEQKQAISEISAQIREQITQMAKDVAEKGDKALGDMKKSLSK